MRYQEPWDSYRRESVRGRHRLILMVQAVLACCLFVFVWILSATNTDMGKMSGQLVWQATHTAGDFSRVWSMLDGAWQKITTVPWIDSVRAVTARPVSPFHYLETPIEGMVVTTFGMGQDGVFHEEVEWETSSTTAVKASAAGKVSDIVRDDASGNRILVMQSGPLTLRYGYLSETWVSVGDSVVRGQTIGRSSKKDGNCSRLSLAIRERGKAIDPLSRMADSQSDGKDR